MAARRGQSRRHRRDFLLTLAQRGFFWLANNNKSKEEKGAKKEPKKIKKATNTTTTSQLNKLRTVTNIMRSAWTGDKAFLFLFHLPGSQMKNHCAFDCNK